MTPKNSEVGRLRSMAVLAAPDRLRATRLGTGRRAAGQNSESAGGTITTIAGSSPLGFRGDGGPATKATMSLPYGLVLESLTVGAICGIVKVPSELRRSCGLRRRLRFSAAELVLPS
jgi:hypothetical protein